MNDVTKLPKWAQREIERLGRDVEYWKAKATAGPDNSDTFIAQHPVDTPLGDSPRIRFVLPNGGRIEAHIVEDHLQVRSEGSSGALHVVPSAANSIRLRLGEY